MQQIKKKNHASLAGKKPKKLTTIPPLFSIVSKVFTSLFYALFGEALEVSLIQFLPSKNMFLMQFRNKEKFQDLHQTGENTMRNVLHASLKSHKIVPPFEHALKSFTKLFCDE